jgi:hypothetical protein
VEGGEICAAMAYAIEWSVEERTELEHRVVCYTLPRKVTVRAKMTLYPAEGLSTAEIARRLETPSRVVNHHHDRSLRRDLAYRSELRRSWLMIAV